VLWPSRIVYDRVQIEFPLDAAALGAFVGEYRDEQGAVSVIRRTANGIELVMPAGHKAPLPPDSPTSFFVRGYGGLTVSFEASAQRELEILHWMLQDHTMTARRIKASD